MDEILVKFVIGEATAAEEQQVLAWTKENKANEKYLEHFRLIWETSKTLQQESILDEELSWQEFKQLRSDREHGQKEASHQPPVYTLKKGKSWIQIAATWLVILGTAAFLFSRYFPAEPELLTLQSFDTVKSDTLSDGSVITLNKNSRAEYPAKFSGSTREMKLLSGEAFFDIAHDRKKPFIVHVRDAAVKVVGTSFNIRNHTDQAEVIVETGIVEVSRKKVIVRLKPAEKAEINYRTNELKKSINPDQFYNYYRTKEFVANKTPLWRIVEVLNDVYKVNIQVPDRALANRQLTTTLRLGSLDPILDIIAIAFNAQIVHEADKIVIR